MTHPEPALRRLKDALEPPPGLQGRVKARLQATIEVAPALLRAREMTTPSRVVRKMIWERILERIEPRFATSVLDRLKDMLTPAADWSLRTALVPALAPVRRTPLPYRRAKWVAAFVIVLVLLRATPLLFLAAPRTNAESSVLVVPTEGRVSVSVRGFWEPLTREVRLKQGAQFRTEEGEATFILNDDGNVRMAPHTILTLHGVTRRTEPASSGPMMSLLQGRVWVQGLVPEHTRGITVATPAGDVTVHGGSVSITAGDTVDVRVWDRHAVVERLGERTLTLVSGERTELRTDGPLLVKKIATREQDDPWPAQNLARDAVHRREIAQLQQERAAARAGILPTSPLYTMKRAAEAVDAFLTFDETERVEKQLQRASTRLDEAAALITAGSASADGVLQEYRSTLLEVASASGGDVIVQFLLRQQVAEDAADVAAALYDDSLYAVKKTVLEASAELPSNIVDAKNIEGVLFLDAIDTVEQAVEDGDVARAQQVFAEAQPYLEELQSDTSSLAPDVKKEALSVLTSVASDLEDAPTADQDPAFSAFLEQLADYLPAPVPSVEVLTEADVEEIVARIVHRIFVFTQPRPRRNQLLYELRQIQENPNEGMILRRLYDAIPRNTGLSDLTRSAIAGLEQQIENEGN